MELVVPEARLLEPESLLDLYDASGPYVRAGMLVSLDGATDRDGRSRPLQTAGDSAVFTALRGVADAVVVGAGTARAEDYGPVLLPGATAAWRRAHGRGDRVPLVVFSRSLDLPPGARWLATGRPLVVTCDGAPAERRRALSGRAEVLVCGDADVDLTAARDALGERGLVRLLCEGGPSLLGDMVRAGLLTELCATVAPLLAGAGSAPMVAGPLAGAVTLELVHLLREQSTLLGRWRVAG